MLAVLAVVLELACFLVLPGVAEGMNGRGLGCLLEVRMAPFLPLRGTE